MKQGNNQVAGASKGLLVSSNSCKTIGGTIVEGGSSSSEENKRPSIVQEQKTEEDAEDNSTSGENLYQTKINNESVQQENTCGE